MKNKYLLPLVFLLSAFSATGCASASKDKIVIRVLNAADYIYEAEEEGYYCEEEGKYIPESEVDKEKLVDKEGHEVYYDSDMMAQFVEYMDEKYKAQGLEFDYIYDTFDTPETCYNELMTGKSNYDVINVSDYMVQKMMTHDLIRPIFKVRQDTKEAYDNIDSYISNFLWGEEDSIFNNIYAKKKDYKDGEDPYDPKKCLADYSVPYMWGTIGIMYNYAFYEEFSKEEIDKIFSSWEVLYSEFASGSFSIKDSVRDVYAVSILHAYKDEIAKLEQECDKNPNRDFNEELTSIFNRCDKDAIAKVHEDMLKLKDNAFGFEVDSGKTDMVASDKIGANLAWSGDAVWAIYEAETDNGVELAFQVPEEGSNIWFDAWCIPTVAKNPGYALDLIEFMSEPEHAISNMDYVGYTSATAGEEVLDYVYDKYDVRGEVGGEAEEEGENYDLTYFFEDSLEEYETEDAILQAWTEGVEARMLKAQFPKKEQLKKLCVMDDYGKDNEKVLDMWQSVRTNPLPLWAIIIFALEAALAVFGITYLIVTKQIKKRLRRKYSETH